MNIRKAAWFAAMGNYAILVLQFCTVIVATRLLSKEDIGAYAVAAAIFNILVQVVDFGVSRYVVHIKDASPKSSRSSRGCVLECVHLHLGRVVAERGSHR